jgi:AraC-like DNA-binding protein
LTIRYDNWTQCASAGQAVLIDCRRPHKYWANSDLDFFWIHLDGSNTKQFYNEITGMHGNLVSVADGDVMRALIGSALSTCRNATMGVFEIERSQILYRILCELLIPITPTISSRMDIIVVRAIEYIDAHIADNIDVPEIAECMNISVSHLSRLFNQWAGCSPYKYIILERINRAKRLLATTMLTVKEISYAVGFNSEVNFITSFTSKVGVSPGNFRKGLG